MPSIHVWRFQIEKLICYAALLLLCSAYIEGGAVKILDTEGAIAEMNHFGIPMPPFAAALVITTEIAAPCLILSGWLRWAGALWLAGFTIIATLIANPFWAASGPARQMMMNGFFEHLGLAGAFLLVALHDLGLSPGDSPVPRSARKTRL
jgi:uncharacterized membrane protein YphA (DoxX/SURF4 family)